MDNRNPYLADSEVVKPTKKYKVTFLPMDVTVEVDPEAIGSSDHGLPGSILDTALAHGIDLDHACGGVCACATCHVTFKQGLDTTNEATEEEQDMLEQAPGLTPNSRLGCQTVPDGTQDVVLEIPGWNRNLAKEPTH